MASAQKRARTESTSTVADGIELKSPLGSHPLMEALAEQRRLGILTDITFVVEGVQFKAHRNVLVASSDFMRSLICGDFKESSSPTVTLDEVASAVFACVLDFCYEGRCRVPDVAVLEDLILAAARFQVLELRTAAALRSPAREPRRPRLAISRPLQSRPVTGFRTAWTMAASSLW